MYLQPDYITPGSMLAVAIVPVVLSIATVAARFWIRRRQRLPLLWDDWLLIPSLLLVIGFAIALMIGVARHSVGFPLSLPPGSSPDLQLHTNSPEQMLLRQIQYATQLMQILSLGLIKSSFIMFYRRIFCSGPRTWFSTLTSGVLALIVAWTITFFFLLVFYCGSNIWAQWSTLSNFIRLCPNALRYLVGLAISDFLMDLVVILLPIPMISQLNMDLKKKLLLIGVFMLGVLAIAASATRMAFFIIDVTKGLDQNTDRFETSDLVMFWSIIENGAALVAACLPTMNWLTSQQGLQAIIGLRRSSPSFRSNRASGQPSEATERPVSYHEDAAATTVSATAYDMDEIETYTDRPGGDDVENKPQATVRKDCLPRTATRVTSREELHQPT